MAVSDKDNEIITKTLMWMLNSTQSAVNAEYPICSTIYDQF